MDEAEPWALMKIAPKPLVAAGTGVPVAEVARLNDMSIVFELTMANVFLGENAGNVVAVTAGLTSWKPSPLTAYGSPKKTPWPMKRSLGMMMVLPWLTTV